jgi:hypothetical protein
LQACGGQCVDIASDPRHCGGCDAPCQEVCFEGQCLADCPGGVADCDPDGAACVQDFDFNPLHCGDCNESCDAEQVCIEGECLDFDLGRQCDTCPCADCRPQQRCCSYPGSALIICVDEAEACPP